MKNHFAVTNDEFIVNRQLWATDKLVICLQDSILHRQLHLLIDGRNKEQNPNGCETVAREAFSRSVGLYTSSLIVCGRPTIRLFVTCCTDIQVTICLI